MVFSEDDTFSTMDTIVQNPCAPAQDDLSFTQEGETNLFSRDDHPQCLPPVNIGADALPLFESPLNSLDNTLLPLNGETSNDLPDNKEGGYNAQQMEEQGWQPYGGSVGLVTSDDSACKILTAGLGIYHIELCCNGKYQSGDGQDGLANSRMEQIDAVTIANQNIAVIHECICAFFFVFFWFSHFFVTERQKRGF